MTRKPLPTPFFQVSTRATLDPMRCYLLRHAAIAFAVVATSTAPFAQQGAVTTPRVPTFRVDPFWPKPLPNRWILGAVAGVAVDSRDHVWVTHRPSTLQPNETRSIWKAAP